MKKSFVGIAALFVPMLVGGLVTVGCGEDNPVTGAAEEACGPCGTIATGDVGISGNAKLDGFFKAVSTVNMSVGTIETDFLIHLEALEKAFVEADAEANAKLTLEQRVSNLTGAISGELNANLEGGVAVDYTPAKCSANLNVAVEAQASCEVKGGCTVEPGKVEVACEGECTGSCSGKCEGTVTCKVEAPSVACTGTCEGTCAVDVAATCEGTCNGTCEGTCSAKNAEGQCVGKCDGTCTGKCEAKVAGECKGTCSGSCTADPGGAECAGEVSCKGSCEAGCSGGCTGEATPPKAECDAAADCQAQAKAQASADVQCTPPAFELKYNFAAGVEASAQASFKAKLELLKVHGTAMVAGFAKYRTLFEGVTDADGKVVMKAPVAELSAQIKGIAEAGVDGELTAGIPALRITCAISAMTESVEVLASVAGKSAAQIKAQGDFAAAFTSGFKAE